MPPAAGPALAQASTAAVSGQVRDPSGAPVPGAEVTVTAAVGGAVRRATSDAEGRFELRDLAPGRYAVVAEQAGLLPAVVPEVVLAPGSSRALVLELTVPGIREVVSVGASQAPAEVAPSTIDVAPTVVQSVAGAGENIYRVLQTLPGVAAVNEFDSRLAVRGGGPDQNLTMMDGVEIHNPYRLFGLTSAFNPETIANFELITGGFNARYGDRLSSILIVDNRPGSPAAAVGATAALSLTDTNVVAEGRLPSLNGSSWLVTARRTYYDLFAERIVDADLPSFADVQARGDMQLRPGHTLSLFTLSSRESTDARFDIEESGAEFVDILSSTQNDLAALSYEATIGARAFSKTIVSWYRNKELVDFAGDVRTGSRRSNSPDPGAEPLTQIVSTRGVSIRDVAVRQQFSVTVGDAHLLESGFETHNLATAWQWRTTGELDGANGSSAQFGSAIPSTLDSARSNVRAGAWITDRWTVSPRVRFEPGLRLDWSGVSGETLASPRLAALFDVTDRTRVRVAGGLFTQSPGYEKLLQSDYFVDLTDSGGLSVRSERAWQALAAADRRLNPGVTVRVEGYYKDFDRLVLGRLETPDEVAARVATYDFPDELAFGIPRAPQVTTIPENIGTGRAYGVELYAEKRATSAGTRLSGWASYTLGRAETTAYGRTFAADYDRRHALSVVSSFRLSRLMELGATFRAQSGFPYTPARDVLPASVEDPAAAAAGTTRRIPQYDDQGLLVWSADYGDTSNFNTARLPLFARVDMRVTFRPRWSNDRWQFYVEVLNLLNRDNASDVDAELAFDPESDRPKVTEVRTGRLPTLPTFGLRYRF
ncbi:MAG TPA: TonB-dependent receptor [Vicinamibacterales bacterium]